MAVLGQHLVFAEAGSGELAGKLLNLLAEGLDLGDVLAIGNVVLEALASAVPAIVTPDGGPKYIVEENVTGFIAPDKAFTTTIANLATNRAHLACMSKNARTHALTCNWDAVFHRVYSAYETIL